MKNRFVVRVALFLSLMGVVCGLSPIFVQASTTNPVITLTKVPDGDVIRISDTVNSINTELKDGVGLWKAVTATGYDPNSAAWATVNIVENDFITFSSSGDSVSLTFDMIHYKDMDNTSQQKTMQVALDLIYNSTISRTLKNKIYNELCALDETTAALVRELSEDVHADFYRAYAWFAPFSNWFSIILGFLALLMFALLGLTMVVDIAYINIPIIQGWLNNEGKNSAKFVSHEAYGAVKEQQSKSGTEYVSPMSVYLKQKSKQMIAIFICLLYLVSGQLYVILSNIMDYFSGVLRIL